MCSFESGWLRDCLNDFKPVLYRCYVDDIFYCFVLLIMHINLRSICHLNIPKFFLEKEKDGLQLMSIDKRPSVWFMPASKVLLETENWLN